MSEETLGQRFTSEEDARMLGELLGPEWRDLPVSQAEDALRDARARTTAEFEQTKAEHDEAMRFSVAVQAAMRERGATYGHEVYDDVARELYGHHTPLTRRVIAEVEALASGGAAA